MSDQHKDYPSVLSDLADLLEHALRAHLEPECARAVAMEQTEVIRRLWGGGLIYIPQGARFNRQQRNDAILREFDGRNHAELARRYRVSVSCVYGIVARARHGRPE